MEIWDKLKCKLKQQFMFNNTSWIVWEDLKRLRHKGFVRKYVKKYSSLILEINNMQRKTSY